MVVAGVRASDVGIFSMIGDRFKLFACKNLATTVVLCFLHLKTERKYQTVSVDVGSCWLIQFTSTA